MAETTTVARPYARAAFEFAQKDKGGLKSWSETLASLAALVANPDLRAALGNPKLGGAEKGALVIDLLGEQSDEPGRNFVKLLADNGRLAALPDIAILYEAMRAEAEKTVHATVTSAFEMSGEQLKKLSAALSKRLDRTVELECSVDKSLQGGAIVQAGDLIIDGSARGRLEKLSAVLRQ